MEYTRILLKPEVELSDVDRLGTRTDEWELEDFSTYEEDKLYQKTWVSQDGTTRIEYTQDPARGVRYYTLTGENQAHHANIIRKGLETYSRQDIAKMMKEADTPKKRIAALYHAGVEAPARYDAPIFHFLEEGMDDPDKGVRRAAVNASRLARWRELRKPLEHVAADDADSGVRDYAKESIDVLNTHVWKDGKG